MKVASISQTRNQLSALIEEVKRGEVIVITDRGKPVARLTRSAGAGGEADEAQEDRLARLERCGLVKRAERDPDASLASEPPPRLPAGASILRMVVEEREQGR